MIISDYIDLLKINKYLYFTSITKASYKELMIDCQLQYS